MAGFSRRSSSPWFRLAASGAISILVVLFAFILGVFAAPYVPATLAPAFARERSNGPNLDVFLQAWELVEGNFVYRDAVDERKMTQGAIVGMLDALGDDGHTRYLTPEEARAERSSLAGRFEGIGAEVAVRDGRTVIVAPIEGSPAQRAGIRAGDTILSVDGNDVSSLSLTEVVNLIRGPKGTTVTLTVLREGARVSNDIQIVRDEIRVDAVTWTIVPETTVAHIRISQFGANATTELRSAIESARKAGADRLIVDVRSNPGGFLDQAVGVTSQFVNRGDVLLEEDSAGQRKNYPARAGGAALDLPLVVLIDKGSASASEIFAGAMQDHERGQVIGQTTFGTGTVLSMFDLKDGSQVLLGTAQWLTPNGRVIRKAGIAPDLKVERGDGDEILVPREVAKRSLSEILAADKQLGQALRVLDPGRASSPARPALAR
jgi:carboxyl-terminal processing protease